MPGSKKARVASLKFNIIEKQVQCLVDTVKTWPDSESETGNQFIKDSYNKVKILEADLNSLTIEVTAALDNSTTESAEED